MVNSEKEEMREYQKKASNKMTRVRFNILIL